MHTICGFNSQTPDNIVAIEAIGMLLAECLPPLHEDLGEKYSN
jgi:hypothetical protein